MKNHDTAASPCHKTAYLFIQFNLSEQRQKQKKNQTQQERQDLSTTLAKVFPRKRNIFFCPRRIGESRVFEIEDLGSKFMIN